MSAAANEGGRPACAVRPRSRGRPPRATRLAGARRCLGPSAAAGRRLAALLAIALAAAAGARGQSGSRIAYRVESAPRDAAVGETARLVLVVEGLSAAGLEVADPVLDEGLALEAKSVRPRVGPAASGPASREVEIAFEFRVVQAGRRSVGGFEVRGAEGSLRVAPLSFYARGEGEAASGLPAWRWAAPSFVRRFEAFELSLARADGKPAPSAAAASFRPPAGMSLEPCGPLSWTAIVLEGTEVELPRATIGAGSKTIGRADPSAVRVRPIPEELESSRAIGRFSLALEGTAGGSAEAGKPALARLVLSGRGNQPAVRLPEPRISLDGAVLPAETFALRRVDASRPAGGGYEGELSLEVLVTPPRPGSLSVAFDDLVALGADGTIARLSVPPLRFSVTSGQAEARGPAERRASPFAAAAKLAADRLGAAEAGLRLLPALLEEARDAQAPALRARARERAFSLLASSPRLARRDLDASLLEAGLRWEAGERGAALAILYGILRRSPRARGVAELAAACQAELGSGPPALDGLPPPAPFLAASVFLALVAIGAFLASRRRRGAGQLFIGPRMKEDERSRRSVRLAAAAVAVLLSLAAASLAGLSAAERREPYAVVWADRLLLVPSERAEAIIPVTRGTAAKVRRQAPQRSGERLPEFVGVVLGDGVGGWVRRDELYYY